MVRVCLNFWLFNKIEIWFFRWVLGVFVIFFNFVLVCLVVKSVGLKWVFVVLIFK